MRVSIIVPDRMVVVDGVARQVDITGVEKDLHAVQWTDTSGDVEYMGANRRNVAITDLTPYQFLLDRWVAAAPPAPPVAPMTKDDLLDRVFADPALGAVLLEMMSKMGITEADMRETAKVRMLDTV